MNSGGIEYALNGVESILSLSGFDILFAVFVLFLIFLCRDSSNRNPH
jgi:hypothetical protein